MQPKRDGRLQRASKRKSGKTTLILLSHEQNQDKLNGHFNYALKTINYN